MLFRKILDFLNQDLRHKFIKFNLYPGKFYINGIKGFYSKIIFRLILNNRIKKFKKFNFDLIFNKNIRKYDHKINAFFGLPKCGHTFLTCVINSYFEIYYKIGNGIPKYDSLMNKYIFAFSPVIPGDMYSNIALSGNFWSHQHEFTDYSNLFISREELNKKKIIFSRYPVGPFDMYDLETAKVAILLREPADQLISWYMARNKNPLIVDHKLLDLGIKKYKKFINFWFSYSRKKTEDKDFMFIKFKDLSDNSVDLFIRILKFFSYEIDEDILKKSILINTKENTLKNIGDIKIRKIRFSNEKDKLLYKEKILHIINSNALYKEILKKFNILY
jgi:hypothetical protein